MIYRKYSMLFFPFGIISLALLSVLCFHKIAEIYAARTAPLHCINVVFPSSKTKVTAEQIRAIRKYQSFILSSDVIQNATVLNDAREALNKIKVSRDTLNGVHILFNDSVRYRDYIKAVNYSMEKFPGAFGSHHNDFWAWYARTDTTNVPKDVLEKWRKKYGELY